MDLTTRASRLRTLRKGLPSLEEVRRRHAAYKPQNARKSIDDVLAQTSLPLLLGHCSVEEWRKTVEHEFRKNLWSWRICFDPEVVSKVLAEMNLAHLDFP